MGERENGRFGVRLLAAAFQSLDLSSGMSRPANKLADFKAAASSRTPKLCIALFLFAVTCFASDLQVTVSPGLGGVTRSEQWTFVRVMCVNQGNSIDGSVVVEGFRYNESTLPESYEVPVSLPRGSKKEFFVYFPSDGQAATWRVRLYSRAGRSQKIVHEEMISSASGPQKNARFSSIPGDSICLVYVADENGRSTQLEIPQPKTLSRTVRTVTMSAEVLPDRWIGYDTADTIVLHATLFQHAMNDQFKALMEWVGTGGHLIVLPRANESGKFHADWSKILGVQVGTTVPFTPDGQFLARYGAAPPNVLRTVFECTPDEILLADERGPVLFRKQHGLGTISFSAVDLISPSWRNHLTSTAIWRDLLAGELTMSRNVAANRRMNNGYDYHAQNIINGLRQIPALRPPSFAWLAAYLCLYLFVMVVLNYLVLRRLDRKEWSLFTFPAIAILFGIGAYWSGYFIRGGTSVLHQVNIVELATGQTQGVARSFLGLFSAVREPCTLTFPREAFPQYFTFNNPGQTERSLPPLRVRETDPLQATVPISVWTMRTFTSDEPVQVADAIRGQLTVSETNGVVRLSGWVENRLPTTFNCRSVLVGPNASPSTLEIPPAARREFRHESMAQVEPGFFTGTTSDQAINSVYQWWSGERREPGFAYLVGFTSGSGFDSLGVRTSHASSQQQTILVVRMPLTVTPGQKMFGPNWWEPDVAQVEGTQMSQMNWNQRASFYMTGGSVTLRYRLLGHQPGRRLKSISVNANSQFWAAAGGQAFTVSVFRRDENTWTNLTIGKAAEFDASQVFDEVRGTVDVKLNAGQGGMQFQPQFIQLTGEAE